ncbi:hypothetical protein SDC9_106149 [bioreactor metagenome]|uniref:Uncharacterized protein n=1 Tax=bioreactor metagenome TaxID=1076179 RepID=A0A645B1N1_9ZZZZ
MRLKHHVKLPNVSKIALATNWTFNVVLMYKTIHFFETHAIDIDFRMSVFN